MVQRKISPVLNLALLAALATVAVPLTAVLSPSAQAQLPDAAAFPLPTTVPKGTNVRIDGANSMVAINQALKQKFEGKFSGTTVTTATSGSEPALRALLDGKLDLAALGRPLTPEEKAQGLTATPAVRDKIAVLVGPNNPFNGSLTIHQFAKIFRGEITDWSEVGGAPGPIRLVDRPETSDTRQAFRSYPVFKSAPFQAVATATSVKDDTAAVIAQLGNDGIGYATANQVKAVAAVRILNMHQVLPDNPRYPFSQPLLYVYKGSKPTPAAQAFLGYATAPEGQEAIAEAMAVEATAIAAAVSTAATPVPGAVPLSGTASPGAPSLGTVTPGATGPSAQTAPTSVALLSPTATVAALPPASDANGAIGWLWGLLPLGLLGAWALLRRKGAGTRAGVDLPATPPVVPSTSGLPVGESLLPPVSPGAGTVGLAAPAVALASPTVPLPDPWDETPAATPFDLSTTAGIVEPREETTLLEKAEAAIAAIAVNLGSVDPEIDTAIGTTPLEASLPTAESSDDFNLSGIAAAVGGVAAGLRVVAIGALNQESQTDVAATKFSPPPSNGDGMSPNPFLADVDANLPALPDGYGDSRIVLLPRDPQWGYAYWDTPNEHKEALRRQGGQTLALRIYDVTDGETQSQAPQNLQQYDCGELAKDWYVPIPFSDRDYVAEIGYLTATGYWLMLAKSLPIRIPAMFPSDWFDDQFLTLDWQEDLRSRPPMQLMRGRSGGFNNPIYDHIFGLSKTADAQRVVGSVFGSMQQSAGSVPPGSAQMIGASEQKVGGSERMLGASERMFGASEQMLGGSEQQAARMMAGSEQFVGGSERMITGSESLSSFSLIPGVAGFSVPMMSGVGMNMSGVGMSMSGVGMNMSGVGMNMSGVGMNMSGVGFSIPAGPAIPPERMSGIGMNMSGVGMNLSGVGFAVPTMSGIGMSGIGFFSSMPPIRSRKFWLVAEAELIIYGATEPDATVYVGGQPILLNPDGTFRFHMPFPDREVDFPVLAIAADGVQTRAIHMNFNRATPERRTNTKDEAIDESY